MRAAEGTIPPLPQTQAELEDELRLLAATADARTAGRGIPRTNGRYGTDAHVEFETMVESLDMQMRSDSSGWGANSEEFRNPAGELVGRRVKDSAGMDVVLYKDGVEVKGLDLKTGRGGSDPDLKALEQRFGVPIEQIFVGKKGGRGN